MMASSHAVERLDVKGAEFCAPLQEIRARGRVLVGDIAPGK